MSERIPFTIIINKATHWEWEPTFDDHADIVSVEVEFPGDSESPKITVNLMMDEWLLKESVTTLAQGLG